MGMFSMLPDDGKISKKEMVSQLEKVGATCKLCGTVPKQFVFNVYRQDCWCPRCGMPPVPQPEFMKEK
jgi:hypothetical protein